MCLCVCVCVCVCVVAVVGEPTRSMFFPRYCCCCCYIVVFVVTVVVPLLLWPFCVVRDRGRCDSTVTHVDGSVLQFFAALYLQYLRLRFARLKNRKNLFASFGHTHKTNNNGQKRIFRFYSKRRDSFVPCVY
jgi:hypothetical protein